MSVIDKGDFTQAEKRYLLYEQVYRQISFELHHCENFIGADPTYMPFYGLQDLSIVGADTGDAWLFGQLQARDMTFLILYSAWNGILAMQDNSDWCNADGTPYTTPKLGSRPSDDDLKDTRNWQTYVDDIIDVLRHLRYKDSTVPVLTWVTTGSDYYGLIDSKTVAPETAPFAWSELVTPFGMQEWLGSILSGIWGVIVTWAGSVPTVTYDENQVYGIQAAFQNWIQLTGTFSAPPSAPYSVTLDSHFLAECAGRTWYSLTSDGQIPISPYVDVPMSPSWTVVVSVDGATVQTININSNGRFNVDSVDLTFDATHLTHSMRITITTPSGDIPYLDPPPLPLAGRPPELYGTYYALSTVINKLVRYGFHFA